MTTENKALPFRITLILDSSNQYRLFFKTCINTTRVKNLGILKCSSVEMGYDKGLATGLLIYSFSTAN